MLGIAAAALRAPQVRLATSLIGRLQTTGEETVVISPAGTAAAIAMLGLGANDGFCTSAHAVLGYEDDRSVAGDLEQLRQVTARLPSDLEQGILSVTKCRGHRSRTRPSSQVVERMRENQAEVWVKPRCATGRPAWCYWPATSARCRPSPANDGAWLDAW